MYRFLAVVVSSLALSLLPGVSPTAPAPAVADDTRRCRGSHWVGAWAAAPAAITTVDAVGSPRPLVEQTVRMVVRPTLSGRVARIHLSHRYGDEPVTLSTVTIARRREGASAVPGTMRPLTFGGRGSVTIPAGGEVTSDRVRLRVRDGRDLLVSAHVSGIVVGPTEHFITNQTNYQTLSGAGDHAADLGATAFQSVRANWSNGWYFLSGIDVRRPRRQGAVLAFGDSITDGYQGSDVPSIESQTATDRNARYPDFLDSRLDRHLARRGRPGAGVLNAGISGNRVLFDPEPPYPYGDAALTRFRADALAAAGVSDLILLEGANDLGYGDGVRPRRLIRAYRMLMARAHRAGLRVHLGTLTPMFGSDDGHGTALTERRRQRLNRWIRRQRISESVVDFDRAVRSRRDPRRLRPAYDSGDRLHPNSRGYRALAGAVRLRALAATGC